MSKILTTYWLMFPLLLMGASLASAIPAAQYRQKGEAVEAAPDGTYFCEAEEFIVETPGWQAKPWGENYYAATFANTFLSRKAFLGAPEQCDETVASITVNVKEAGKYLVLARYEAPYRFETQFRVKVEQNGKLVLDRLYGARGNLKIWAFGYQLQREVAWGWGAVENMVWEGHDAVAELQPGLAKISLIAGKQPEDAGKRNVDLIMLTKDVAQVQNRIEKEAYLPLDGWLTQAGDVYIKVTNSGQAKVNVKPTLWQEHSPYWIHMRNWAKPSVDVEPGKTSDWVDVGGTMDTLNDGQWMFLSSGPCQITFGVKNAAGKIEPIRTITANGKLSLAGYADVRYSRQILTQQEAIADLVNYLKKLKAPGKLPTQTPIYAFCSVKELYPLFNLSDAASGTTPVPHQSYFDWRGKDPAQLQAECDKLSAQQKKDILVVSLGDEIGLPSPSAQAAKEGFVAFLQANGVKPDQIDPAVGGNWDNITYNADPKLKATHPGLYYWSMRYLYTYGIQQMKQLTDVLQKNLPNARIGANFSPHHGGYVHSYLGEVFKWVSCFRQNGMTLPWAEDYIWQVPVGSPQMNGINLDLFRAGQRGKPGSKILYYVMPHAPGNTPNMWRRLFYNALGHGMTIVDLFEFEPVWAAYTENHVTGKAMYGTVLKTLRELGRYEDIVQSGQVRTGQTGLWFSETGDIWGDNEGPFAANKRAIYVAILDQQVPLDVIIEDDALNGTLSQYHTLYLTDRHVSQAASRKIAEWVKDGGVLFATAGAGMLDEYNSPNTVLRELMGVDQQELVMPKDAQVGFIKEDLPFAPAIGSVTMTGQPAPLPIFGAFSKVTTAKDTVVTGMLADQSPAVITRAAGKGQTIYCAFLPGLSYFKPAIPRKPLDRGSTDDAMAHFIPTVFDQNAGRLIAAAVAGVARPIITTNPLVEATVIESKAGTLITLTNWSGKPINNLRVTVTIPVPTATVSLASSNKVTIKKAGHSITFTLNLDVADALILR